VEFVGYSEAWRDLAQGGVVEAERTDAVLRVALEDTPGGEVVEVAAIDHVHASQLPADVVRLPRERMAELVERIVHKMHLTRVCVIPVGKWRQVFEAVAEGMASNAKWQAVDSTANVALNTRDPLMVEPADHHTLRDLVAAVLTRGTQPVHGIAVAAVGTPLVIEAMPAGEIAVYAGKASIAAEVRHLLEQLIAKP
jgi:hypothetical protein